MSAQRTCRQCVHCTRMGTCAEPAAAGLAERFVIAWPPAGYAAQCEAHQARPLAAAAAPGPFFVRVS